MAVLLERCTTVVMDSYYGVQNLMMRLYSWAAKVYWRMELCYSIFATLEYGKKSNCIAIHRSKNTAMTMAACGIFMSIHDEDV